MNLQWKLESERLFFREWDAEMDSALAIKLWGNKMVTRYIDARENLSEGEALTRLSKEVDTLSHFSIQYWPIFLKTSSAFIGCCGLRPHESQDSLEIGIHLLPDFWGKGLAKEAMQCVIRYAFDNLRIERLFAGHNPHNIASKKLLLSLGFEFSQECYYPPTGLMHPSYYLLNPSSIGIKDRNTSSNSNKSDDIHKEDE